MWERDKQEKLLGSDYSNFGTTFEKKKRLSVFLSHSLLCFHVLVTVT